MKTAFYNDEVNALLEKRQEQKEQNFNINYKYPGLKIAVIMPAFNEEQNIGKTLSQFPNDISDKLDIIIIDDGSKDNTINVAQEFDTIIIRHHKNKGNGAAIQTGLEFCRQNDYEIAVILDADGQHDPQHIPKFIDPIVRHKVDFVIGNRFKYHYNMKVHKKLLSRIMSVFYSILLQKKISDPTMGYRALSAKIFKNIRFESNYSITQEMLFKIVPNYTFREVCTKIYEREFGESFISIKKYLNKTILSIIKFYLWPKFNKIFNKILNPEKIDKLERKLSRIMKT
ncbi:MAG: glycosyltransferase family 2 protein [Promethearchaeota archaeon]